MNSLQRFATPIAAAVLIAGCATSEPYYGSQPNTSQTYPAQSQNYPSQSYYLGYVDRIEVVKKGDSNNIAGTIIGGVVGGLIGSQIGGGRGQTAATIVGAAGGAYAGHEIQGRRAAANESFRVTVRLDNGSYQTVTMDSITDLRSGDRVRVEGNNISRI